MAEEQFTLILRLLNDENKLFKFKIKSNQNMANLMGVYCQKTDRSPTEVKFLIGSSEIQWYDTPASLKLQNNNVIEAFEDKPAKQQEKEKEVKTGTAEEKQMEQEPKSTLNSSKTPAELGMFSGDKIKVIAKNPQNIELNIRYKGNNHKINVDSFAPLIPSIRNFCVDHGFNSTGLRFLHGPTQFLESSTPRSLKMNKGDVIEISNNYQININVYNDGTTTRFMMKRFTTLHFLMKSYCSKIGERDISKFYFYHRGKPMSSASTPDSLKMNDGDFVQVFKKK